MAKKGKKNKKAASGEATLATNRRARHDYKTVSYTHLTLPTSDLV